jgi:hypothetical protein
MGININELQPLGSNLLSGSESIMGNLRLLSEDELSLSGGGEVSDSDDSGFFFILNTNSNNGVSTSESRYFYY